MKIFQLTTLFVVVSLNYIAPVTSVACKKAQLKGLYNTFRFTGSMGIYQAGTKQVVSYDRPLGSNVSAVVDVDVVSSAKKVIDAPIESGAPATLPPNGDYSGSVVLILPTLDAGSYKYRMTVTSGTNCTLDSPSFNVIAAPKECTAGTSKCLDLESFSVCSSEGTYSEPDFCTGGTTCKQNGDSHSCVLQSGGDDTCTTHGSMRCKSETTFQHCNYELDSNGLPVLAWTPELSCGPGTVCQESGGSIQCVVGSSSGGCTDGQERCTPEGDVEACSANEWIVVEECTAGTSCKITNGVGACTLSSSQNCEPGYMRCSSDTAFDTCVQNSTEWIWSSESRNCPENTTCTEYMDNYILCK